MFGTKVRSFLDRLHKSHEETLPHLKESKTPRFEVARFDNQPTWFRFVLRSQFDPGGGRTGNAILTVEQQIQGAAKTGYQRRFSTLIIYEDEIHSLCSQLIHSHRYTWHGCSFTNWI